MTGINIKAFLSTNPTLPEIIDYVETAAQQVAQRRTKERKRTGGLDEIKR